MTMRRYEPRGLQAIHPEAMFLFFDAEPTPNVESEQATVVTVRGPLMQHAGFFDSYESIRLRVGEACLQSAPVVVLRVDSPGGDIAGLFDTARAIRSMCDAAGKRLEVHVEGQCSSAAYALACTADRIVASRTASVGSIGVIAVRVDETAADAMAGVTFALVTSGAQKAYGNSHEPLSAEELAVHQAEVDALAVEFFELVAMHRPLSSEAVAALEAASFRGEAAVGVGLIDELGSFEHLLASLGASAATGEVMEDKEQEARDALRSIAEDEECSEATRAKARKALAALDGEDEPAKDEPAGEGEEPEPEPEKKDEEEASKAAAAPGTVSAATAGALAAHGADVERRLAKLEAREEAEQRRAAIAAHGGVPAGMAKLLASKPLAEVRAILAELPKPKKPQLGDAAATAVVAGTRGAGQDQAAQLPPDQARAMRRAMGIHQETFGVVERGNILQLGAPLPEGGE